MNVGDIWQEHRRFITTVAAALTAVSTSSGAGSQPASASSTASASMITRGFSPVIVQ